MMKTTLFMATSADGFIACNNGNEDFLSHQNWLSFLGLVEKFGHCIRWRVTYEKVRSWGGEYLQSLQNYPIIVVSQQHPSFVTPNTHKCKSPQKALELVQTLGYKEALLSGGATLNTAFAKKGLLDEIIINCNPIIIGKGKQMFIEEIPLLLTLKDTQSLASEIIQLCYRVDK